MINSRKIANDRLKVELQNSMNSLFSGETNAKLLDALNLFFPRIPFAFIVDWIPEQGEDIYEILIDCERIAVIEVPRKMDVDLANIPLEIFPIGRYENRHLPVDLRRKLKASLELMHEYMTGANITDLSSRRLPGMHDHNRT